MVCKEDILLWFKESASYKRIDVICNLLNMCIPFELRFVGTFIQTIGKHSYQELRGAELKANNPLELASEVAAHPSLSDGTFRRKVTLYLSLLHSYNHTCAKGIYDILTSSDLGNTENGLEELLLLFTMAINHPAFTFEQHTHLGKILMQLLNQEKAIVPVGPPPGMVVQPWVQPMPQANPPSPLYPPPVVNHESPVHSRTTSPVQSLGPPPRPQQNPVISRRPFQRNEQIRKVVNHIEEPKDGELRLNPRCQQNGLRTTPTNVSNSQRCTTTTSVCTQSHVYCQQQIEKLSLVETTTSRHCSSSSEESGRSSTSHSPPLTPSTQRKQLDHSARMNGRLTEPPPAIHPPPPGIPYPQPPYTFTFPNYRPFTYQNGDIVYTPPPYTPFVPLLPPQYPPPPGVVLPVPTKLSCWNCGAAGHTGNDCTEPTIEEITRPGNYQVDFSTSPPQDCNPQDK